MSLPTKAYLPNLCLIHTPCIDLDDYKLEPPLGLLYIGAMVNNKGYYAKLIDLSIYDESEFLSAIPDSFHIYGFSTYTASYQITKKVAIELKKRNPMALFIAGGPHATALPKETSQDFDVVVLGEGELAILEVINLFKEKKKIPKIITGIAPELNSIPFPNFKMIDIKNYTRVVDGKKSISILTSRGCPYKCVFCNSNILGGHKPMRYRNPDNIIREIQQIKKRYKITSIRIQDDMFNSDIKRIRNLSPLLAKEHITYRCFARVNTMSEEMALLLKDSGCLHVSFGVESGCSKILESMQKGQTPLQIRSGLENATKAGLKIRIFLIVGFPGETNETINETLALVKDCPWDEFSVYPVIPYPGTVLHDRPQDFGITYINKNYSEYLQIGRNFKAGFVFRTKDFDENMVRNWRALVISELLKQKRVWAGKSQYFK